MPRLGALVTVACLCAVSPGRAADAPQPDWDKCRRQFMEAPEDGDGSRCFFTTAGRYQAWDQAFRQMEPLLKRYPDLPWLQHYFAHVLKKVEPDEPRVDLLYLDAADAFAAIGEAQGEIFARQALIDRWQESHRYREAREQIEALKRSINDHPDPEYRARLAILEASQLYFERRDLGRAWWLLHKAEGLLPAGASVSRREDLLINLSGVGIELGKYHEVLPYLERLTALAEKHNSAQTLASALFNRHLAYAGIYEGEPTPDARMSLLDNARRIVEVGERSGSHRVSAKGHLELGRLLPLEEATPHFEACVRAARRGRHSDTEAECSANQALTYSTSESSERIAQLSAAARSKATESGDPRTLTYVEALVSQALWQSGAKEAALASLVSSLERLEDLRRQQTAESGRAQLFSTWADHNQAFFGFLLQEFQQTGDPAHLELAFHLSERMRSRVLSEVIAEDTNRPDVRFAELREIQAALEPDEALLVFQISPDEDVYGDFAGGAWVLLVTHSDRRVHRLPRAGSLHWRLPALLGLLKDRGAPVEQPTAALHRDLLDEILRLVPDEVDSLLLLPDGLLNSLPFGLLRAEEGGPTLAERYAIHRLPSATLWLQWRRERSAAALRPALVLADPSLPYADSNQAYARVATRGAPRDSRLDPLPLARMEARSIHRHLGPEVRLLEGHEATESVVKTTALHEFNVIHLAAHAKADHGDPESSTIFLAPEEPHDDGLLQFREIVDLDLTGRTVVLSACDTASGEVLLGEGVLDLAHAFFRSGAHAVVASLWPLRDDDGQLFFDHFYRHLARGESLAGAAQAAQRERIAQGAPPAAWAGIVVLGDGSLVPFPDAPVRVSLPLALLLCLGLLGTAVAVVAHRARVSAAGG